MNNEYMEIEIIDDLDEEQTQTEKEKEQTETNKKIKSKTIKNTLKTFHENNSIYEIGVDEVGRGPLFGRVYSAAVVLPKDDSFDHFKMKDSKKFHSKKKIQEVADYIKMNAIAWSVTFEDECVIDEINILQATQQCMHKSILKIIEKTKMTEYKLLIDGNYFKPLKVSNNIKYKFACIEGGDNIYSSIAAASIIAKVERDKYIEDLCNLHPDLIEKYGIDSNKGYGAKKHMDGIKEHGITPWHRRTFGICKQYS
jgi:ribonuclease HII